MYRLTLGLLCSILLVLLCLVLPCTDLYCSALFFSALALFSSALLLSELWRRRIDRSCIILTQKSVSEYVPVVLDQCQPTRSQHHSEYKSTGPRLVSSSIDSKSVSECIPLVPDQSQPTRSQLHSKYHSYHWSQTSIAVSESVPLVPY